MAEYSQHKQKLLDYFDSLGFERWSAIYGDVEVSRIRRTIREGHAEMLALATQWLCEGLASGDDTEIAGSAHVLDAGCGTGLLSVALARRGVRVAAVDLAPQMAVATEQAAARAGVADRVAVCSGDIEGVSGMFDAVACLDVLVHYPAAEIDRMVARLAAATHGPLLLTYAPREPLLAALHWLGGRFPTAHRRTEIQMIPPRRVAAALADSGMLVRRTARISRGFYHVTLVEAARY